MRLRVVAAAVLHEGAIYSLPAPARHHDVLRAMHEDGVDMTHIDINNQGFLLSDGRFCMRRAACLVAERAGQIRNKTNPPDMLFSEDVW